MNAIKIVIPGEPMPKQSARFRIIENKKKGTKFISSYQKNSVVKEEERLKKLIVSQLPTGHVPFDGPVGVRCVFVFPPLKSWSNKKLKELKAGAVILKDTKPDNDNLFKVVGDALEGTAIKNDSRISIQTLKKIYGLEPRTEITIGKL